MSYCLGQHQKGSRRSPWWLQDRFVFSLEKFLVRCELKPGLNNWINFLIQQQSETPLTTLGLITRPRRLLPHDYFPMSIIKNYLWNPLFCMFKVGWQKSQPAHKIAQLCIRTSVNRPCSWNFCLWFNKIRKQSMAVKYHWARFQASAHWFKSIYKIGQTSRE